MKSSTRRKFVVAIAVILALSGMFAAMGNREERIGRFIRNHEAELLDIAQSCLSNAPTADRYKWVKVDGVFSRENTIVQFLYSATGLVPSSKYYGFYYSDDKNPAPIWNTDVQLEPDGENKWVWSDGTDNGGLTKQITENWFYYEAWF